MKRKKYNIITFSLLAFFFLFGFLSKHLKEPVKPAAKTHHISHSIKMEIKKSPSLLKADEVGADQKMAPMPLTEEAVEVTIQPSPQVLVEEAITQAQLIRAMSGLTTLITILTSTHKLHQAQIQLPIPINEITEY